MTYALIVLFLCGPGIAAASTQQPPLWSGKDVQRELRLTAAQVEAMDAVFRTSLRKLRTLNQRLDAADSALWDAMALADDRLVVAASERVAAAQTARNTWHTLMLLRIRRILTPGQRARLAALQEARERDLKASGAKQQLFR